MEIGREKERLGEGGSKFYFIHIKKHIVILNLNPFRVHSTLKMKNTVKFGRVL